MWWVERLFYRSIISKSPNCPMKIRHSATCLKHKCYFIVICCNFSRSLYQNLCQINSREINCVTACFIFIRGVGCIFYEMACGRPLFPGSTVEDELYYIFKILGTPTEENFPGISKNEEFLSYNFSQYESENLINVAPR